MLSFSPHPLFYLENAAESAKLEAPKPPENGKCWIYIILLEIIRLFSLDTSVCVGV